MRSLAVRFLSCSVLWVGFGGVERGGEGLPGRRPCAGLLARHRLSHHPPPLTTEACHPVYPLFSTTDVVCCLCFPQASPRR
jgi:hypothetical protein